MPVCRDLLFMVRIGEILRQTLGAAFPISHHGSNRTVCVGWG